MILMALLLSSCSAKFQQVGETAKLAFLGQKGAELTPEQIAAIPYASIYARQGDGPQAFMVLAFAEQGLDKWVSSDHAMLVTRKGRLVKAIGLEHQLISVSNQQKDPVIEGLKPANMPQSYSRKISWMPGYFSDIKEESSFQFIGKEQLTIAGHSMELNKFTEFLTIPAFDYQAVNTFWVEPDTGLVRKSIQHYAPDVPPLTITQLRPYIGKYS